MKTAIAMTETTMANRASGNLCAAYSGSARTMSWPASTEANGVCAVARSARCVVPARVERALRRVMQLATMEVASAHGVGLPLVLVSEAAPLPRRVLLVGTLGSGSALAFARISRDRVQQIGHRAPGN
jgi:hypothetical protein